MDTIHVIATAAGLIAYGSLIWFVCRLVGTNHLEDDEQ